MASHELESTFSKVHLWRYLSILVVFGLAVYMLVPQITTLQNSWSVVQGMIWWTVVLAIISQVLSYLRSGFMLYAIVDTNQKKLSVLKGTLITMASVSIGLVAGGWAGGAAATYGWVRREDVDGNTAVLAGTLAALLSNGVQVEVSLIGTPYLLVLHDLSKAQWIEFNVILVVLGLITTCILVALRFPEPATRCIVWLADHWATLRHKTFTPENTVSTVHQLVVASDSLRKANGCAPCSVQLATSALTC